MGFNHRLFIRLYQQAIIKDNLVSVVLIQLKRILSIYSELPKKSYNISKNLHDKKRKLEKATIVVKSSSNKVQSNLIDLIR